MRNIQLQLAVALVSIPFGWPAASAWGQAPSSAQIVEDARTDYYNLPAQGLKEFRCDVRVDWDAAVDSAKMDAAGRGEVLRVLRQTHFEVAVGTRGASRVSLGFEGAAPSDDLAARVQAATAGVLRSLSGALDEFSSLSFGSPLPPDRDYRVEAQGDRVRVTFGSDDVRIVETMNKDHAIEEMIVATQHATVTVRPEFKRSEKGFLPAVIDSSVEAAGADKMELHVEIAYQKVQGFDLPLTVRVRDRQVAGGAPLEFSFSNYQVTR
jgi:hypothetical protein